MADIIKFRAARKKLDRQKKEERAAENRALFGQTKAEKDALRAQKTKTERHLDGHQRDDDGPADT